MCGTLDRSRSIGHIVDGSRSIDVGNCSRCIVDNCRDRCNVDGRCDSCIDATRGNHRGGLVVVVRSNVDSEINWYLVLVVVSSSMVVDTIVSDVFDSTVAIDATMSR